MRSRRRTMVARGSLLQTRTREDAIRLFILDRSERLFIAHGYQKASMDLIARECGLSKPTLYKYFQNKYELFTSLYVRLYLKLQEMFQVLIAQKRDKRQVLEDIIHGYFVLMTSKKDFLRMYFREQHLVIHENIDEHMTWHIESRAMMENILARCLKEIIRPEAARRFGAAMVASTLFDILEGMVSELILHGGHNPAKEKAFIMELLRTGVVSPSA